MKIRNSQLRFLGSLALVLFIMIFFWEMFNSDKRTKKKNRDICLNYKEMSYAGKVTDTYKSKNRGTFVFVLLNDEGEKEYYNYCLVYPEAYIEKGDSIYKVPNSFEYHIYKGGDPSQEEVIRCEDNYCNKWK